MASNKSDMEFIISIVDKATNEAKKIQTELGKLADSQNKAAASAASSAPSFAKLTGAFTLGNLAAKAFSFGLSAITNQFSESVRASNEYASAMIGLNSVSAAFGVNQQEATTAAKSLAADGLMAVGDSSDALKNLIATNYTLEQSIQLMNAFKDSAAFNRQGQLGFGEAVVGATQGLKNQMSVMVDNAGITKNLSVILSEAGYSAQDLQRASTDVGVRMALFNGILKEASAFSGDAARAANTLQGAQNQLGVATEMLQVSVGQILTPSLMLLTQSMADTTNAANGGLIPMSNSIAIFFAKATTEVMKMGSAIKAAGLAIIETIKGIGTVMGQLSKGDFSGAWNSMEPKNMTGLNSVFDNYNKEIKDSQTKLDNTIRQINEKGLASFDVGVKNAMDRSSAAVDSGTEKMKKKLEELEKKFADVQQKMADESANFGRKMENATYNFQQSLQDMVIRHRDAIIQLKKDIDELTSDFNDSNQERVDSHAERVDQINEKYAEETANMQANLARRLSDEHGSDEQLIVYFQNLIAEKDKKRDEDLAKEEAKFTKEQEKALAAYNKAKAALEEKLGKELEIQRKHQADFDAVKDKAAEDDITRLKTSFEREMTEIKRQHNDRMEELRKEQEEILALKAAMSASAARGVASSAQSRSVTTTKAPTSPAFVSASRSAVSTSVQFNQTNNINTPYDYNSAMKNASWQLGLA